MMARGLLTLLGDLWRDEFGGDEGARLGIGLAGAAVGFALLGPFGASVGFLAGQVVGNILFPQELPDIEGPRLDGSRIMTSAYGDPVRIGFGRFVVGGSVTYYPGFEEHVTVEESGGKGGGPTQTSRSYTYTGDFGVDLCEGPADAVLKIWANRKLIYDAGNTTNPILDAQRLNRAPGANAIRIYLGTEDQLPDPTEQADKGVSATPAYRGVVRLFFDNYPLDDSGGVPPQISALVSIDATEEFPSTTLSGVDLNSPNWQWYPDKTAFFISGGTRVNNLTQTVDRVATVSGDSDFPGMDSEGNLYTVHDGVGGVLTSWTKWDGVTLQELWSADLGDPYNSCAPLGGTVDWSRGRMFGGIRLPDGTLAGELMLSTRPASDGEVLILDPTKRTDDCGGVINRYLLGAGFNLHTAMVVDNERHLWVISGVTLFRIGPGSGNVVEQHTLGEVFDFMSYDPATNSLILGAGSAGTLISWSLDTNAETGRMENEPFVDSATKNDSEFWNGPSGDGMLYLQTGATLGQFKEYDIRNMRVGRSWSPGVDFGLTSNLVHRGMFDESRRAMIKRRDIGGQIHWLYLDRQAGNDITVKSIVDDVSARVGLAASDIVTTNLTDTLHGYLIDRRMSARNALEPLRKYFFFNPVEEDFVIKFPKLGTASVASIPESDLAAGEEDIRTGAQRLEEDVTQEVELPELLELTYANAVGEYLPVVQRAKRPRSTTNSRKRRTMSFPGTFIDNEDAARRLETLLYNIWSKRRPVSLSVSQKWLALSPADVVDVTEGGVVQEVILGDVALGANNVIELKGAADDPTTLTSVATGEDSDTPVQTIVLTAASSFFVMDIPLLRDADQGFGVYVAAGPSGTLSWPGAELLRSLDGTSYAPVTLVGSSRAAEHGFAIAALADGDADVWDRDSSLQITMLGGTLPSSTEAAVLDGANALLIGSEVVCYVDSVDNGDGKFTVSTLLRGRAGTEGETGGHVGSERVVVLSSTTLIRKALDVSDKDQAYFYKAVTRGGGLNESARKTVTVLGKSLWQRAVAHVVGSIASDDWTVTWEWRTLINGSWKNLLGVLPGVVLDFEVDVLDAPGGSVLSTYTTTATGNGSVVTAATGTFFYDDADQTADFGSPQTTLTVRIYQMDPVVGRGFPSEATLVGG